MDFKVWSKVMKLIKDILAVFSYIIILLVGTAICLPVVGFVLGLYFLVVIILIMMPYIPHLIGIGFIYWLLTLANVFPIK